jgi:phage shock protein A
MWNAVKRWWKYRVAKTERTFNEKADPAVQLEQAIGEAGDQHRRLKEQAANVIANQKQAEMRLNRSMDDYERLSRTTRQAVLMADQSARAGDTAKASEYTTAAEAFANRLITMEAELEQSKSLALQASQAAEQAKAAVAQNAQALQRKLAERQKLMSQLDQAKMQEQVNTAMSTLNDAVGMDVPTFAEVRDKIEARYARAKGAAEIGEQNVENHMLEIEQAAMNVEAQARLVQIREQMGLPSPSEAALGRGTPSAPPSLDKAPPSVAPAGAPAEPVAYRDPPGGEPRPEGT